MPLKKSELSASQVLMIEDGAPLGMFLSDEERKEARAKGAASVMKKHLPFGKEPEKMISLTTNSRGKNLMSSTKTTSPVGRSPSQTRREANLPKPGEEVSAQPPADTAKQEAGEVTMAKKAKSGAKKAKAKKAAAGSGAKKESVAKVSENKRAAEFKARPGTVREKLIIALDGHYRSMIPRATILKACYGSQNVENVTALNMSIKGMTDSIGNLKLPYEVRRDKDKEGAPTIGLYPKS